MLKYFKITNVEPIRNSDKIKWVYLKNNPLHITQIAFKGYDDPKQILDFIKEYIDYDKLFNKALFKKIKVFYEAMNWEEPMEKENTLERFF